MKERMKLEKAKKNCGKITSEKAQEPKDQHKRKNQKDGADGPDYVFNLKKSLYGLKQSARCWNQTLDNFLATDGYRRSPADECIYVKTVKR